MNALNEVASKTTLTIKYIFSAVFSFLDRITKRIYALKRPGEQNSANGDKNWKISNEWNLVGSIQ